MGGQGTASGMVVLSFPFHVKLEPRSSGVVAEIFTPWAILPAPLCVCTCDVLVMYFSKVWKLHLTEAAALSPVSSRHEPLLPAILPAQWVWQSSVCEARCDGAGWALWVSRVFSRPHHVPGFEKPHPRSVVHKLQSKWGHARQWHGVEDGNEGKECLVWGVEPGGQGAFWGTWLKGTGRLYGKAVLYIQ